MLGAWRVSVATIDHGGRFSDFSGYDRTIVALDGGLTLCIDGTDRVLVPLVPLEFSGDAIVDSSVRARPMHDLNVMTRRDAATHRVEVRGNTIEIAIACSQPREPVEVACTIGGFTTNPLTVNLRTCQEIPQNS